MSILEVIGVEKPIIQAGMGGGVARHELAVAVSESGGLGTIAGQTPLTYLAFLLVPVLAIFLRRHVWGFRLQGVGEAPEAARSLGVNTAKYRYGAVLPLSDFMAGAGKASTNPGLDLKEFIGAKFVTAPAS